MGYSRFGMIDLLKLLGGLLVGVFRSHAAREAEMAFLRQQLVVLQRSASARLRLRTADRLIFVWLYRLFPSVLEADFWRFGPPRPLQVNHLPCENCAMLGRIGEVGLNRHYAKFATFQSRTRRGVLPGINQSSPFVKVFSQ
jgi:hypothetical protein